VIAEGRRQPPRDTGRRRARSDFGHAASRSPVVHSTSARGLWARPGAARLADSIHLTVALNARQPLLFGAGATMGNRYLPAASSLQPHGTRPRRSAGTSRREARQRADARQSRTAADDPVTVTQRTDEDRPSVDDGRCRARTLGAGDYVIGSFTADGAEHKRSPQSEWPMTQPSAFRRR
jgi:hypothetical protein